MPKWVEKILKYNPGGKSFKAPFAIYLDLECLLKKEKYCQNNSNNNNNNNNNNSNNIKESYTEKKAKYEPSGWAMFTRCLFYKKENKLSYYRGKDCIEKLCKKLNKRGMKIINYEKKKWYHVSAPELAWQACLKKTKVKSELLRDYDMILMIEKGIRGGICQAIDEELWLEHWVIIYRKYTYLDANNLYGWAMSQKLPVKTLNG